jgi:hypothetical protein
MGLRQPRGKLRESCISTNRVGMVPVIPSYAMGIGRRIAV